MTAGKHVNYHLLDANTIYSSHFRCLLLNWGTFLHQISSPVANLFPLDLPSEPRKEVTCLMYLSFRSYLSFEQTHFILLSIIPIHAVLVLLHARDSVGPSRTHASQSMKGENINWSPVVLHQNITEALCKRKALVNKLPAACLKGSAYCTTVRLSTAVTLLVS